MVRQPILRKDIRVFQAVILHDVFAGGVTGFVFDWLIITSHCWMCFCLLFVSSQQEFAAGSSSQPNIMMKDEALTHIFKFWKNHSPMEMQGNLSMHFVCTLWMSSSFPCPKCGPAKDVLSPPILIHSLGHLC